MDNLLLLSLNLFELNRVEYNYLLIFQLIQALSSQVQIAKLFFESSFEHLK